MGKMRESSGRARKAVMAAGAGVILAMLLCALFAPYISPLPPERMDLCGGLSGPSRAHVLGQDKHGRDVLSRLIFGARVSVAVGIGTVLVSAFLGFAAGALAGLLGGVVDQLIMRVVDVLLAFPGILLAIALTAVTGPSVMNVIVALSVRGWVGYARVVRAQVLVEREKGYVEAANAMGAGPAWIITRHLLPNTMTPVIVQATFGMAGAILAEASLSFLGLGPRNVPTWGAMLADGASFLRSAPHIALFPGIAIMATVLAFNFLGDSLRDVFSPKDRS
jgi:peptide/nickel transport system permease protein